VTEARWYHSTVPATKVEAVVQEITENFAKIPDEKPTAKSVYRSRPGSTLFSMDRSSFLTAL